MPCPDMAPASVRGLATLTGCLRCVSISVRPAVRVSPDAACAWDRRRWPWRGRAGEWSGTYCRSSWRSAWPSRCCLH